MRGAEKYHFHLKESSFGLDEGYLFFELELEPVIIISYPNFSESGLVPDLNGFFLSDGVLKVFGLGLADVGLSLGSIFLTSSFFLGLTLVPILPIIFISYGFLKVVASPES